MIKIAKNPYLLMPVRPSDHPGQPKYAGRKEFVNVTSLKNPLHPFMDITNLVAFIHGIVALLTIEYRYPMADFCLVGLVWSMNVIQNPAWEAIQYFSSTESNKEFLTSQYNNDQRRIKSGDQTSQWSTIPY